MDWQPIETAPQPNQYVLITDGKNIFMAEWTPDFHSKGNGAWTDHSVASWGYQEETFIDKPTHWMPLPDPPKEPAR